MYDHVLEDGVFERVIAHEDVLIRQLHDIQAEQAARRTGRGGVGNINRAMGDPQQEYCEYPPIPICYFNDSVTLADALLFPATSISPRSGGSGPRDFGGRGRGPAVTGTKSPSTTSSSNMSVEIQGAQTNSRPLAPLQDENPGPLFSVLVQENGNAPVTRGYDSHLGTMGSPVRRINAGYAIPHGAMKGDILLEEPSGASRLGAMPLPRLYIPHDHPPPSHQSETSGRRPLFVTNANNLETVSGLRPQNIPALDGNPNNESDSLAYFRGSRMSPPTEAPLSSQARYPQRPIRQQPPPFYQRGFDERVSHQSGVMDGPEDRAGHTRMAHYSYQTTHASPTVVSPSTPSTLYEESSPRRVSGGKKGTNIHDGTWSHPPSDPRYPAIGHVRESGADRRVSPEFVGRPQEEDRDTQSSDFFDGRGHPSLEIDSVNSLREGTPFSDRSSILGPRQTSPDALSSTAKLTQRRPTNGHPQSADIPLIKSTEPTLRPRPRSHSEEESLHRDELDMPPHRALSKMEKAILRRIEFGPNVDLSRVELS